MQYFKQQTQSTEKWFLEILVNKKKKKKKIWG